MTTTNSFAVSGRSLSATTSGLPWGGATTHPFVPPAAVSTAPSQIDERVRAFFQASPDKRYANALGIHYFVSLAENPDWALCDVLDSAARARATDRISLAADLLATVASDPVGILYKHVNTPMRGSKELQRDILDILLRSIARSSTPEGKNAFDAFLIAQDEGLREAAIDALSYFERDDQFVRSRLSRRIVDDSSPRLQKLAAQQLVEGN